MLDAGVEQPLLGPAQGSGGRPRLFINPWVVLAASMLLQLLSGVQYVVALWAPTLKDVFGYSQSQIQGMISPPFFVAVIGWLPGLTYDALARRHRLGPRHIRC
jgi:Nodulin-like